MEVDQVDSISIKRWELISKDAKDLILSMISLDPRERPTITEVLQHSWTSKQFDDCLPNIVYQEMEARKDYIISSYQKTKSMTN